MRDLIGFLVFGLIVFFVVGETVGWTLGVPGQTPVFVYKRDGGVVAERRTVQRTSMPVSVEGRVRDGEVVVRVIYEDTGSFQTNQAGRPPVLVFEETYRRGQRIAVNDVFDEGRGEYRIELSFRDASGTFRVGVPNGSEL